jgi:hypothetical protein
MQRLLVHSGRQAVMIAAEADMFRRCKSFIFGLLALSCVGAPGLAAAEPQSAAMMSPFMENVVAGEVAKRAEVFRELLSQYYRLLPQKEVVAAEAQADRAACSGTEACMAEVRRILGVDVVYHLRIEDQGYVDPVHLTRLGDGGVVKQYTLCNRCTRRLYRRTLEEMLQAAYGGSS